MHVNLSSSLLCVALRSVPGLGVNQEGFNLSPLVDLTSDRRKSPRPHGDPYLKKEAWSHFGDPLV